MKFMVYIKGIKIERASKRVSEGMRRKGVSRDGKKFLSCRKFCSNKQCEVEKSLMSLFLLIKDSEEHKHLYDGT